ncbi:MAG: hypothetical protein V5A42_04710 [Halofilum sp. (in: g-proteobacteria)]
MIESSDDDAIPLLEDVVRSGREASPRRAAQDAPSLSEDDIEAIAARVVERHTHQIEQAVARAIRQALAEQRPESDEQG